MISKYAYICENCQSKTGDFTAKYTNCRKCGICGSPINDKAQIMMYVDPQENASLKVIDREKEMVKQIEELQAKVERLENKLTELGYCLKCLEYVSRVNGVEYCKCKAEGE